MPLTPGARLGPYEIVGPLGAGGMGEVYGARDTRLDRAVAIKILRQEFADSADRRARFEREARAIASLNHPHICTLHDIGHQDGIAYLVMERLEGETLADRLVRGPLPFGEALASAGQVAEALDRAHSQGIVHRDLKPANIMLTRSGVKLLDFGLARLLEADTPALDGLTRTATLTQEGTIVGTLQYMAPEQLEGKPTDARTDLFAFGAILYEMVTGRRAFDAPSQAGIVGAILHAEVPSVASAPPAFARVLTACLAKKPEDRWSSAHDVRLLLKGIGTEAHSGVVTLPPSVARRGQRAGWIVAAVALAAMAAVVARTTRQPAASPPDVLSLVPPTGTTFARGDAPQVSPDGRDIAFVATDDAGRTFLYLRSRSSTVARPLAGTDDATLPFWAPDGRSLGFFARGALKTVAVSGGTPRTLARAPVPRGGTWSKDDVIVFVPYPNVQAQQIPVGGGTATPVQVPNPASHLRWFPSFLPDGRHYLYLAVDLTTRRGTTVNLASLDSAETRELVPSTVSATYAAPGVLLFRRDAALAGQRFDDRTLQLTGTPTVLADNVDNAPTGYQMFASASAGVLIYQEPDPGWHFTWFDRNGRRLGAALPAAGQYNSVCLSRDGTRLVYDRVDAESTPANIDLWSFDVERGASTRLTFDPATDFNPVCAPTGDEIAFASLRGGSPNLFRQVVSAPGREAVLLQTPRAKIPTDWSRDGRFIVFSAFDPATGWDVWMLPLAGGQPFPFAATPDEERNAKMSPDGRYVAYTFVQGGKSEVYVQPYPATGAKWQISRDGGQYAAWSADGRTLFYVSADKRIMAVDVVSGAAAFAVGQPRIAVDARIQTFERIGQGSPFAVTPDGSRFIASTAGDTAVPVTVVLNWQALLGK